MDEVQLEVLNLDGLAMKNQATEQITNITKQYKLASLAFDLLL